jgi:predicted regulator of Ras-like GTPase activity (Roadblock/LC7/MglB family)
VTSDGTLTARAAVLDELRRLRSQLSFVDGSIVASTDGLIIAHDISSAQAYGVEPESVAALSAVNLGLSQRVVDTANHGTLRETVVRGTFGQVITYPAGDRALLTVIVAGTPDLETLHGVARHSASRVSALLAEFLVDPF